MLINEIFASISGEAARAGYPVIFIRTYGCNLRCTYCDTEYAITGGDYAEFTPEQILKECELLGLKKVVFTGGEPLLQKDATELVDLLCDNGYEVEIETNGAVHLPSFHIKLQTKRKDLLSYTVDYKTITSGMNDKMLDDNFEFLAISDVLKFVVGSKDDLDQMKEVIQKHPYLVAQIFVSPVWGKIEPKEIVEYILENKLNQCRVQLQLHKIIWDMNKRGV